MDRILLPNRGFVFVKTMTVSFCNFGPSENTIFCDNNVNVKLPSDRKVTICFSNHLFCCFCHRSNNLVTWKNYQSRSANNVSAKSLEQSWQQLMMIMRIQMMMMISVWIILTFVHLPLRSEYRLIRVPQTTLWTLLGGGSCSSSLRTWTQTVLSFKTFFKYFIFLFVTLVSCK